MTESFDQLKENEPAYDMSSWWWFLIVLLVGAVIGLGVVVGLKKNHDIPDKIAETLPPDPVAPIAPATPEERIREVIRTVVEYQPVEPPTREEEFSLADETLSIQQLQEAFPSPASKSSSPSEISSTFDSYGLEQYIEAVVYLNMQQSPRTNHSIEDEIINLNLPLEVKTISIQAQVPQSGHCFSHLVALTKSVQKNQNVLILEDQYHFLWEPAELKAKLDRLDALLDHRWDVVVLDRVEGPCKAINDEVWRVVGEAPLTAYLVNRHYVPQLFRFWLDHVRQNVNQEHGECEHPLAVLQKNDMWVTFALPPLDSPEVTAEEDDVMSGVSLSHFEPRQILIMMVATDRYNHYVRPLQKECSARFLKGHRLHFLLFTDQPEHYPEYTPEGARCYVYPIPTERYPNARLHKFQYLLQAQHEVQRYDYVYYMDVDYRVYHAPMEMDLLVEDGILAVAVDNKDLTILDEKPQDTMKRLSQGDLETTALQLKNHVGRPETNPQSAACIQPEEKMSHYYTAGFFGGVASAVLELALACAVSVEQDEEKGVLACRYDESHLNRYLLDHPPKTVLDQSYMFAERCLDPSCEDQECQQLRLDEVEPRLVQTDPRL